MEAKNADMEQTDANMTQNMCLFVVWLARAPTPPLPVGAVHFVTPSEYLAICCPMGCGLDELLLWQCAARRVPDICATCRPHVHSDCFPSHAAAAEWALVAVSMLPLRAWQGPGQTPASSSAQGVLRSLLSPRQVARAHPSPLLPVFWQHMCREALARCLAGGEPPAPPLQGGRAL
jgi:hypothetical protein